MELFGEMEGNSNGSFSLIYRRHLPYYLEDAWKSAEFFRGEAYRVQWQREENAGGFLPP